MHLANMVCLGKKYVSIFEKKITELRITVAIETRLANKSSFL